jgi:hypothetical protein
MMDAQLIQQRFNGKLFTIEGTIVEAAPNSFETFIFELI